MQALHLKCSPWSPGLRGETKTQQWKSAQLWLAPVVRQATVWQKQIDVTGVRGCRTALGGIVLLSPAKVSLRGPWEYMWTWTNTCWSLSIPVRLQTYTLSPCWITRCTGKIAVERFWWWACACWTKNRLRSSRVFLGRCSHGSLHTMHMLVWTMFRTPLNTKGPGML